MMPRMSSDILNQHCFFNFETPRSRKDIQIMNTVDIEGSRPKSVKPINKPFSSLSTEDIAGARPNVLYKLAKKIKCRKHNNSSSITD